MLKLFLLFTVTPLVELYLLIKVGQVLGAFETVIFVIIMGFAGAALARYQGLKVLSDLQEALIKGEMPSDHIIDGFLVVAGGAMLITPGLITDFFGLSLVASPTRRFYREFLKQNVAARFEAGFRGEGGGMSFHFSRPRPHNPSGRPPANDDDIIDV